MSRRDDGPLVDLLVRLTRVPFWVSVAAAAFFYVVLTYLSPLFAGSTMTGQLFGKKIMPEVAPWLALAALAAGVLGTAKRSGGRLWARLESPLRRSSPPSPTCPTCGKAMVKRTARKGASAGSAFWGCSSYPTCRGTRAA